MTTRFATPAPIGKRSARCIAPSWLLVHSITTRQQLAVIAAWIDVIVRDDPVSDDDTYRFADGSADRDLTIALDVLYNVDGYLMHATLTARTPAHVVVGGADDPLHRLVQSVLQA